MGYKGISELNGSYKLSETVINRILSRDFSNGCNTISNYEILALVHFSQICDISGVIEEYKIPDLADYIGCSRRASYNIVENLVQKGFLTMSKATWAGYRRIVLLDNDFSNADFSKNRYINTNFSYLNHNDSDYSEFRNLSLFAKKTLLIILLKYQTRYGYRVELGTLKNYLGVSRKDMVLSYIEELRSMFDGRIFEISSNSRERIRNHSLCIPSKLPCFIPKTGLLEENDCYIKFRTDLFFRKNGVICSSLSYNGLSGIDYKNKCLHQIYSLYVHYAASGVPYADIKKAVEDSVLAYGRYDELVLYDINRYLTPLIKNIS